MTLRKDDRSEQGKASGSMGGFFGVREVQLLWGVWGHGGRERSKGGGCGDTVGLEKHIYEHYYYLTVNLSNTFDSLHQSNCILFRKRIGNF